MKNKNSEIIHIKADEEVILIIEKLRQCEASEITLSIPSNALLLQSVVNLKILKKKAEEFKKNISIITTNGNNENENAEKRKIKMSDIVRKTDKINLNEKEDLADAVVAGDIENKNDFGKQEINNYNREVENKDEQNNEPDEKNYSEQENVHKINRNEIIGDGKLQADSNFKKIKKQRSLLPSISSKVFAAFIFVCIATTALITFFVFQKVDIVIALKTQETDYNFEFVTDESISEIDAAYSKIPVERIEVVNEETETYSAMGKKHVTEKASGKITVFNEYSSNPQKIVANTRFLSKEGQLFRISESITIPGFSRVEGKDVPGQVTATIFANKAGEGYNIGPSSFTLPGLQGSGKYSSVYARSEQAMSGGIDKDVLYFSESDYITAKDKLVKNIKAKSEQDFLSKISDEVILLENTKEEGEVEVETNVKIGAITDDFQMTVSVKTSALSVNKDNLNELISAKINSELGENMRLVEGSRKYEIGETVKDENNKITMPVYVTQGLVTNIDPNKIKKEIANKNEAELSNYFNNLREVKSANVEFWPSWIKNIPSSWDKINIEFEK